MLRWTIKVFDLFIKYLFNFFRHWTGDRHVELPLCNVLQRDPDVGAVLPRKQFHRAPALGQLWPGVDGAALLAWRYGQRIDDEAKRERRSESGILRVSLPLNKLFRISACRHYWPGRIWSPRQVVHLSRVGYLTSPGIDTRWKGPTAFSVSSETHRQSGVDGIV